ncbi:MAG: glycosyltransferase family 4 protein [Patescibacteria group bacterium]
MSKVLLVTMDYFPNYGGVATYYSQLVKALKPGVAVLTNVAGASDEHSNEFHVNFLWKSCSPQWLPLLWLMPRYLKKNKAKVIWVGNILPIGAAALILNLFFKIPYFISLHGLDIQLTKQTAWKKWLAKHILNRAKFITVNSKFTAGLISEFNITLNNVIVVYPSPALLPSPQTELIASLREKYKIKNKRVILTVSRLVKRKNIAQVVEAMAELVKIYPEAVYIIIGDGPERQSLEDKVKELNANTYLIGTVSQAELAVWYNLCDIFVLTPISDLVDVEGFGVVYTEALSLGKSVVASNVGGVAEAVGKFGKYVNSSSELVYTLKELLIDDNLRQKLGVEGREYAKQYNLPNQANKISSRLGGI